MKRQAIMVCSFLLLAQVALAFNEKLACSREGAVTIHATDQDIQKIFRTFSEQTHLKIVGLENLHRIVSVDFDCQDARDVLDALVVSADARYRINGNVIHVFPRRRPAYVLISR